MKEKKEIKSTKIKMFIFSWGNNYLIRLSNQPQYNRNNGLIVFNYNFIFFVIITTFLFPKCSQAQNVPETINYINTIFKLSSYDSNSPSMTSILDNMYDSIAVDKHGKLECYRYVLMKDTKESKTKLNGYTYLRSIKVGNINNYNTYYTMTLNCIDNDYCFVTNGGDISSIYFSVNSSGNRDKLFNAFKHLLELAQADKNYYEKDPFQK